MNRQFNRLGQKLHGKIQQFGQKLTHPNIQHVGNKIQHIVLVGLRKAINTAGEITETRQKEPPYLYGIAHATGISNQAMPILHAVGQVLNMTIRWKTIPSKHSTSFV